MRQTTSSTTEHHTFYENRSVGNRAALLSYGKAPQRITFVSTFDLRRVSGGRHSYIRCFRGALSLNA